MTNMDVDFEDYLDAETLDQDGNVVGTLLCFWTGQDGDPVFFGIKTEWTLETSVVPKKLARANERHSCICILLPGDKIKAAPTLSCDKELDVEFEEKVYRYFEVAPPVKRNRVAINAAALSKPLHSPQNKSHPASGES
jgi:hypothetical protein